MIEKINENIETINSNIEVLPKKTKKNLEKYQEYLDDCIKKYQYVLDKDIEEINNRCREVENKYSGLTYPTIDTSIDYDSIKLSDRRAKSSEKLNLEYLFYRLEHSSNNLEEVNKIITEVISNFRTAGIGLTEADFNFTKYVHEYIKALLSGQDNIQDVFNEIYWKETDILKQIELNVRYLYYKNESKLNDYFKNKYSEFDFSTFIHEHKNKIMAFEKIKHESAKYNFDLFMNGEMDVNEFLNENRKQELYQAVFVDLANERNYENLVKLRKSLYEYKEYKKFEFIIADVKALYEHKAEYKDLLQNKLKDIAKKEKTIIDINKKLEKTGFFKPSESKKVLLDSEKTKTIQELVNDYQEVDSLKIKDTIYNYVNDDTNYYDIFKLATYNFNYFTELLKKENAEITTDQIKEQIDELQKYIYDNYVDIIDNIKIIENKDIGKIICDKYQLNSIIVKPENLDLSTIDKYIETIDKTILFFDIDNLALDLEGIKFIQDAKDTLK